MMARAKQAGFTLIAAVFLVVVVALIAGYAVSIGSAQQADTSLSLLARRADFAAQSGLEWAIARVINTDACPANGTSFTPAGKGISSFAIVVNCTSSAVTEGAASYAVYTVTVIATQGTEGREDFARRTVTAQIGGKP
jgi:MSHA biogenesis protein MshP